MITPVNFPTINYSRGLSKSANHSTFSESLSVEDKVLQQNEDKMNGKYNPHHSTFEEFASTIKALVKEGKLAGHDILLGTANFERTLRKENPNFRYYITPTDSLGRRDWVKEFEALAQRELQRGNMLGYQRNIERKELALKIGDLLNCNS